MGFEIAGIQPVYLPWIGYFDQMRRVDAFLIADELDYTSSGWAHRNRIKGPGGPHWLTLPARPKRGQKIDDVRLDPSVPWKQRHLSAIRQFYARRADTEATIAGLAEVLDQSAERLVEVDIPAIRFLAAQLGIETPILISSELGLEAAYERRFPDHPGPTHRIIAYLQELGADALLEGASGRSYFDVALFESHGMKVRFHDYDHPHYDQLHGSFVSHMSTLDLVLCVGPDQARKILASGTLRPSP